MTQPAKGQEPSMEEILASIRRIIADEDPDDSAHKANEHLEAHASRASPARAAPASPEPVAREEGFDSILARLHASSRPTSPLSEEPEPVERMAEPVASARGNDDRSGERFEAQTSEHRGVRGDAEQSTIRDAREQGLISPATAAAVDAALNTLAEAVQVRNGPSLEEVVTELLRPMLKSWLDENLPGLVERLVRAEIERVTRNR
jgi:cell pole-organizing protein PopZ